MILSIEMGGTKWEGLNQQASHQTTLLSVNAKSETFQQKKSMLFACSVRLLFSSETLWGELMQVETWCAKGCVIVSAKNPDIFRPIWMPAHHPAAVWQDEDSLLAPCYFANERSKTHEESYDLA